MTRKREHGEPEGGEVTPAGVTPTHLTVEVRGPDGPGVTLMLEDAALPGVRPLHLDIPGVEGEVLLTQPRWHLTERRWQARALIRVSGPVGPTVEALKAAGFKEAK